MLYQYIFLSLPAVAGIVLVLFTKHEFKKEAARKNKKAHKFRPFYMVSTNITRTLHVPKQVFASAYWLAGISTTS